MKEYKKQRLTMDSVGILVKQHIGTWHPIEQMKINGRNYFLLEHDTYGQDVASVIVDDTGVLYAQEVYTGFSEEIINLIYMETTNVDVMPDPEISISDMEQYGYGFLGMFPISGKVALEYFQSDNIMIFALYPDGTEIIVNNENQLKGHIENGGLFGIDKQDWIKYMENCESSHSILEYQH